MAFETEEEVTEPQEEEQELSASDFERNNKFLKHKPVGETLTFEILKVIQNKNVKGINKETKKEFEIGLKDKSGNIKRIDIITPAGETYTVGSWEIYFKLFDQTKGLLIRYALAHKNSFSGAKVSITRNYNGAHASMDLNDLSKVIGKSVTEAKEYQATIKKYIKEQMLFDVKVE